MSKLQVDSIYAQDGVNAPDLPAGLTVTGIATATSFKGDGSALTGIDAGVAGISTTGFSTFVDVKATGVTTFGSVGSSGTSVFIQGNVKCEAVNAIGIVTATGINPGTNLGSGVGTAAGTIQYNSTTGVVEVYRSDTNEWIPASQTYVGAKATGGHITQAGTKIIHTFSGTADFKVHTAIPSGVDYLIVAGGGGMYVGGGGGGGVFYKEEHPVSASPGIYPVVVGAGGAHQPTAATDGSDSSVFSVTAEGGGATAQLSGHPGAGGSGGGAYFSSPFAGGTGSGDPGGPGLGRAGDGVDAISPTNGWGNDGGTAAPGSNAGGGGGGAGTPGTNGGPVDAGAGGDGIRSTISGSIMYYGAGGGGGGFPNGINSRQGLGGKYGGGSSRGDQSNEHTGQRGTGGGGGGGYSGNTDSNGGSGIVIIAYPDS